MTLDRRYAYDTMLPRLRPRCFYDLVIEVAIVRPGPIQGDMVHPYLRRRSGKEAVSYPTEAMRAVLGKTLGVPLFQEQAMRVAMVGAGFTAPEADRFRKGMAAWKRGGAIDEFGQKIVEGMARNGYLCLVVGPLGNGLATLNDIWAWGDGLGDVPYVRRVHGAAPAQRLRARWGVVFVRGARGSSLPPVSLRRVSPVAAAGPGPQTTSPSTPAIPSIEVGVSDFPRMNLVRAAALTSPCVAIR